ncbi:hypothetical protein GGX14DRAFT_351973, partial [Mycena pura]
ELWLEVFENLSYDSVIQASLTDRGFCRLTRPLLFSVFDFHPYALSGGISPEENIYLPAPEKVEKAMERLRFWCSEQIAPLVRSCQISPWDLIGRKFNLVVPTYLRIRATATQPHRPIDRTYLFILLG